MATKRNRFKIVSQDFLPHNCDGWMSRTKQKSSTCHSFFLVKSQKGKEGGNGRTKSQTKKKKKNTLRKCKLPLLQGASPFHETIAFAHHWLIQGITKKNMIRAQLLDASFPGSTNLFQLCKKNGFLQSEHSHLVDVRD